MSRAMPHVAHMKLQDTAHYKGSEAVATEPAPMSRTAAQQKKSASRRQESVAVCFSLRLYHESCHTYEPATDCNARQT